MTHLIVFLILKSVLIVDYEANEKSTYALNRHDSKNDPSLGNCSLSIEETKSVNQDLLLKNKQRLSTGSVIETENVGIHEWQ